jgi:multiple sugar transport system ATP-binding protein
VSAGRISFAGFDVALPPGHDLPAYQGKTVILGIRPSDLEDVAVWHNERLPTIDVTAEVTEELGSEVNVIFTVDAPPVLTEDTIKAASETGEADEMSLIADEKPLARFCARVDARTVVKPGQGITLSIDSARFHFFDPATGASIEADRAVPAGV